MSLYVPESKDKVVEYSNERCIELLSQYPYFFVFEDYLKNPDYKGFKNIAGASNSPSIVINQENYLNWEILLQEHKAGKGSPVFYLINYEFRKAIESLNVLHTDNDDLPWLGSMVPDLWLSSSESGKWKIEQSIIGSLAFINYNEKKDFQIAQPLKALESRDSYIKKIEQIHQLIEEGIVYELNYCMFFEAQILGFDPMKAYCRLKEISPMPFSSLVRWNHHYVLCASPELFMRYNGKELSTKPIKGTIKKSSTITYSDASQYLRESEKEIAENMMIVDLSRNDLNKYCIPGSVKVPELFGVYEFPQLFHMISTISGIPEAGVDPLHAALHSFPMGSMTGAPKISAMNVIESLENNSRNMFSGSLGYQLPDGTFDFNVVIRSIFYNSNTGLLHFAAGSAITIDSDPQKEYEECILKAKSIFQLIEEISCNTYS